MILPVWMPVRKRRLQKEKTALLSWIMIYVRAAKPAWMFALTTPLPMMKMKTLPGSVISAITGWIKGSFQPVPIMCVWLTVFLLGLKSDGVVKSLIYCVVAVFQELDILYV